MQKLINETIGQRSSSEVKELVINQILQILIVSQRYIYLNGSCSQVLFAQVLLQLIQNPDVYDSIQSEIDQDLEMDNFDSFMYLEKVITETLRLFPSILWFERKLSGPVKLNGFEFPKNTVFNQSIISLNQDEAIWKDPQLFNPDRWISSQSHIQKDVLKLNLDRYMSIDGTLIQLKTALVVFLRRYQIRKGSSDQNISITLKVN